MIKFTLKNLLRFALMCVCVIFALVLLIAEPNGCDTTEKWVVVLIASKFGAITCGWLAYHTHELLDVEAEEEDE